MSPLSRGALERLERYEDERLTYRSEGAWGQQCPPATRQWGLARLGGCGDPVCQDHDLEREPPRGRLGDDDLSDRRQIDQGGHGSGGNSAVLGCHIWKSGSWTSVIPHQLAGIINSS